MLRFNISDFADCFVKLLPYLPVTFNLTFWSFVASTIIGLILAGMKIKGNAALRRIAEGYTTVARCVPQLVMIFLVYYGVPKLAGSFGLNINEVGVFYYVCAALSLMMGGSMSEIIRSAYLAVPVEQMEAGFSVGLTDLQVLVRIVVPQAFIIALPNLGNMLINLFKCGALAYTIGYMDIMGEALQLVRMRHGVIVLEAFAALTVMYWGICLIMQRIFSYIEGCLESKKQKATVSTAS